jgi:hypothetical protein
MRSHDFSNHTHDKEQDISSVLELINSTNNLDDKTKPNRHLTYILNVFVLNSEWLIVNSPILTII